MDDFIPSAGLLLYKENPLRFLLVHPSGEIHRNRPWGIPKGIPDEGESTLEAAKRETMEEAGVAAPDKLNYLGFIDYVDGLGRKRRVFAYSGQVPEDCQAHCASWEVDKAEFLPDAEARKLLHPAQLPFIERLAHA